MNVSKNFALDTSIYFGSTLFDDETVYNVQNVNLPGLDFSHPQISSRTGAMFNATADQVTFNDLSLTILLDEDFNIWLKLMSMAFSMVNVPDADFTKNEGDSFILITDSLGNVKLKVWYRNSKIMSVGDLNYSSSNENMNIVLDLMLKYDYMDIEFNGQLISSNPDATVRADAVFDISGRPTDVITTTYE